MHGILFKSMEYQAQHSQTLPFHIFKVRSFPHTFILFFFFSFFFFLVIFSTCRSRGGVPPLHTAVPRGAVPRGALPTRVPSSRGRGVPAQRARGAPPPGGFRTAPPIVQDTYGEYVSRDHRMCILNIYYLL